jgi:two-component system, cell cycle sensor histidine kinase and response regulator CckA
MAFFSQTPTACFTSPNDLPRRRTVLLVEDEPFVRDATFGILANAGFEVLCAADVPEATQLFEGLNRPVDMLMTDLVLPHGDGQLLGKALRKHSPDLAVLVTSGYSNVASDLEEPANRFFFLSKPYSRRTLVDKIEGILAPQNLTARTQQAG